MKLAYPEFSGVFQWNNQSIPTLIIENQTLLRKFLKDIYQALNGVATNIVLSKKNTPIDFSKNAEIITDFLNFNLNQKSILNKIHSAIEKNALSAENYLETQELISNIENEFEKWAFDFPCNIVMSKIAVSNLIKAMGVVISDEYEGANGDAERLIDYMELVREFERDKLFVTVNMRSFFADETVEKFIKTAVSHEYKVLMIETKSHKMLQNEKRLTVDEDLCEF